MLDAPGTRRVLQYAAALRPGPTVLRVRSHATEAFCGGRPLPIEPVGAEIRLVLPPPQDPEEDDEVLVQLRGGGDEADLVLRRSLCRITRPLDGSGDLSADLTATLYWLAWRRYSEISVFRRFPGFTAEVIVMQPRLRRQVTDRDPTGVLGSSTGTPLLVKCGERASLVDEWERIEAFLRDRDHPFMSLPSKLLEIAPEDASPSHRVTTVSQFLGGDVLYTRTLESSLRVASGPQEIDDLLGRLFGLLRPWHVQGAFRRLDQWPGMLTPGPDGALLLFGRHDLRDPGHRADFTRRIGGFSVFGDLDTWMDDLAEDLLPRIGEIDTWFSLTHGDLHPRNVLVHGNDLWLIDFGNTGVAPSLFDFAKLEVFLREWFLPLPGAGPTFTEGLMALERTLLQSSVTGVQDELPVADLASSVGVPTERMERAAEVLTLLRRHSIDHRHDHPDHRAYIAVLYLVTLKTVSYAWRTQSAREWTNFVWLLSLAATLEAALRRIFDLPERVIHPEKVKASDFLHWNSITPPGAPTRLHYLLQNGSRPVLPKLAGTAGILQGPEHHLDVLDHTLLSLATVEGLLEAPVPALREPAALAQRADAAMKALGRAMPHGLAPDALMAPPENVPPDLAERLAHALDPDSVARLKWCVVLQALGKAVCRQVLEDPKTGHRTVSFRGFGTVARHLVEAGSFARMVASACPECETPMAVYDGRWLCGRCGALTEIASWEGHSRFARLLETLEAAVGWFDGAAPPTTEDPDHPLAVLGGFALTLSARGPQSVARLRQAAQRCVELLA